MQASICTLRYVSPYAEPIPMPACLVVSMCPNYVSPTNSLSLRSQINCHFLREVFPLIRCSLPQSPLYFLRKSSGFFFFFLNFYYMFIFCVYLSSFSPTDCEIHQNRSHGASQVTLLIKNLPANIGDAGLILGSGKCPRVGSGNPLKYSCLENFLDGGDQWALIHGVAKFQTWLSTLNTFKHTHMSLMPLPHSTCLRMRPDLYQTLNKYLLND